MRCLVVLAFHQLTSVASWAHALRTQAWSMSVMNGSDSFGNCFALSAHMHVLAAHIHCFACEGPEKKRKRRMEHVLSPAGKIQIKMSRPLGAAVCIYVAFLTHSTGSGLWQQRFPC